MDTNYRLDTLGTMQQECRIGVLWGLQGGECEYGALDSSTHREDARHQLKQTDPFFLSVNTLRSRLPLHSNGNCKNKYWEL